MTKQPRIPHGWFTIPGLQTGERDLAERLEPIREHCSSIARGATVLDLGCAEGLIGKWFLDQGAQWLDGLDLHEPYLQTAREIMKSYPAARFQRCDFDQFYAGEPTRLNLLGYYDIVLVLNIAQKLKHPRDFLINAGLLCRKYFVLSLPNPVINDSRSDNIPCDSIRLMKDLNFQLCGIHTGIDDPDKGHLGVRMFFKRNAS